jgi:hypothetical protein
LGKEAILAAPSDSLTEINVAIHQLCSNSLNLQDDAGVGRRPMADS